MSNVTEWCASSVLGFGALIVMVLDINNKSTFDWKKKISFCLLILGISWLMAIFWGIVHPIFETINFVYSGPIYFVSVTFLLILDLVICDIRNKKRLILME